QAALDLRKPVARTHLHEVRLSAAASARCVELARELGVTVSSIVQAAWAVVLARYSGSDEVLLGVTTSGRPADLPGVESIVGLFLNTLPLRVPLDPARPAAAHLTAIHRRLQSVIEHGHLPLSEIQRAAGVPSGVPLFHSFLAFENYPGSDALRGTDSIFAPEHSEYLSRTNYPLAVIAHPGEEIVVRVIADADCFSATKTRLMAEHIAGTAAWIAEHPAEPLVNAPVLTAGEERTLLSDWNDTARPYAIERTISQLFEEQVRRTPEAVAVIDHGRTVTFRELNGRANAVAARLIAAGVGPDAFVGISVERSIELAVGLMAILKAGGAYLPLEPDLPDARLQFMLEDSGAAVLIAQDVVVAKFPRFGGTVVRIDDAPAAADDADPPQRATPRSLCYLAYTSGSTGNPKGVMVPHVSVLNRFEWLWETYPFAAGEVGCQISSINFVDAVWEIFSRLLRGVPYVVASEEEVKEPRRLAEMLIAQNVTRIDPVPSLLKAMLDAVPDLGRRWTSLRVCVCSGEVLPVELARRFLEELPHALLINRYGSTEATSVVSQAVTPGLEMRRNVPVGRPIANIRVYILDPRLHPVPSGVPGTIYVGGPAVARGYWNRPDLTAERFIADPFRPGEGRLYRTGDTARYREDGTIEILGREDNQLNVRGFRIEPGEIESLLSRHEAVRECVVVARRNGADMQVVAFYVPAADEILPPGELRRFLLERLPEYMVPTLFVALDALPLTVNGKLDRKALVARGDVAAARVMHPPRDVYEARLARLWQSVLGVEAGVDDPFLTSGGHSLLAVRLVSAINDAFGTALPVAWIFSHDTIEAQARVLREESQPRFEAVISLRGGGAQTPIFLVHAAKSGAETYVPLARLLSPAHPLYAVESVNLYGREPLIGELEELAARYAAEIRRVRPHGPYILGGWSMGGVLAYEIALQLERDGETVERLLMLDSFLPSDENSAWSRQYLQTVENVFATDPFHRQLPEQYRRRVEEVGRLEVRMTAAYRPRRGLRSRALLIKAARPQEVPLVETVDDGVSFARYLLDRHAKEDNGWGAVLEELEVHAVDADHHTIVRSEVLPRVAEIIELAGTSGRPMHDRPRSITSP
ncbi:MAG TPA: amino acid adenylation domain-containing protein, partial [Thermoanaerobaculia bacterium]|nr:amino acid adenylation domain-containing protein [Thermoanaerobaculia bacterium]